MEREAYRTTRSKAPLSRKEPPPGGKNQEKILFKTDGEKTGNIHVSLSPDFACQTKTEGSGGERLRRGDGAVGRDIDLAARPWRWRRARIAAPTAASKVRGSSAARAASRPVTAGLHARTHTGRATRRSARRRCLRRMSGRTCERHM